MFRGSLDYLRTVNILFVSATVSEASGAGLLPEGSAPVTGTLFPLQLPGHTASLLVTGVGQAATAYELGRHLALHSYDLALNIGVAGSFRRDLALTSVVWVKQDCFADLGAEDGDGFLSLFQLGFSGENEFPFQNGVLVADFPAGLNLPAVSGVHAVSVNKVQGRADSIKAFLNSYPDAEIESMEGAAFYYACLKAKQPCLQLRAVSNYVETRNRAAWKIREALDALKGVLENWLSSNQTV